MLVRFAAEGRPKSATLVPEDEVRWWKRGWFGRDGAREWREPVRFGAPIGGAGRFSAEAGCGIAEL